MVRTFLAGVACLLMAGAASAADLATGNPKVQSVESIAFGPDGLLIIGDGKGSQVIAVQTDDLKPETWGKLDGKDINEQIGGMLGTNAKGVQIVKLAVNPASKKVYLAVKKLSDKQTLIVTVNGQGQIKEFSLDNVKYNRYKLPNDANAQMMINDLTFADGRIILAAKAGQQFVAKIYTIDTRQDDATPMWISTETFHVAHNKWETNAPIQTVIPYVENGKKYLVGAFTCTPIVKYSLDDLAKTAGTRVKGESVIELGHGNTPQDMFVYEKGGKTFILINNNRAFMQKNNPVGPSPFWTAKVDFTILSESQKINKDALWRITPNGKATEAKTDRAVIVPEYHGVMLMDKLDNERAAVIRTDDKGGFWLNILPLP
jgi:hypothetical protein